MTNINRPVIVSAKAGVVIGEDTGRKRSLLTVRFNDGTERKYGARMVEFSDVPMFAPPVSLSRALDAVEREMGRDAFRADMGLR